MTDTDEIIAARTLGRLDYFTRKEENAPNFRARLTLPQFEPPIKVYIHNSGLEDAFPVRQEERVETEAKSHLIDTLETIQVSKYFLVLASVWGNNGKKMIDFFGYHDIQGWPGNPSIDSFVTKNGVIVPRKRPNINEVTCGDGLIVFGAEEQYRRTTKGLKDYIRSFPKIHGLDVR